MLAEGGVRGTNFRDLEEGEKLTKVWFEILYIYFIERGREGEKEGERHQCVVASSRAPVEDLAHNPGMCPKLGIKPTTL